MPEGFERALRLAMADWLDWAAEHPDLALRQVEGEYDSLQPTPHIDQLGIRWA
jgi:hypothetical protein